MEDVERAFDRIDHHGEPMGFNVNHGLVNPTHQSHWQGITRHPYAGNYFYVTKNRGKWYEIFTTKPGLAVVRLGASETNLARRSNLHRRRAGVIGATYPTTPPPDADLIEAFLLTTNRYQHLGGPQAAGNLLAIPYEDANLVLLPLGIARSAVAMIFDIREPGQPVRLPITYPDASVRPELLVPSRRMGALGMATDAKLESGAQRYVVMAEFGGSGGRQLGLWSIAHDQTRSDLRMLREPLHAPLDQFFQNLQLVRECGGDLYAVGIGRGNDDDESVELFRVRVERDPATGTIDGFDGISSIKARTLSCANASTSNQRYCVFRAGGGVYVDPQGTLALYGVEYQDSGATHSTRLTEFWDRNGNPSRTCDAEGGWLTLYRDTAFRNESLTVTYANESQDDFDNFKRMRWNDRASSARACLPAGCAVDLCKHAQFESCLTLGGPEEPVTTRLVSDANLHEFGMGDEVSSVRFRGSCGPIGGWGTGEPNDLNGEDCVEIGADGLLNDASCRRLQRRACRNLTDPLEWRKSEGRSQWSAALSCPAGFAFDYPRDAREQQALAEQIGEAVWVNLSDREQEGRFVPGSSGGSSARDTQERFEPKR